MKYTIRAVWELLRAAVADLLQRRADSLAPRAKSDHMGSLRARAEWLKARRERERRGD